MPRFGGEKALTKNIHDDMKCPLSLEEAKIEVAPQIINNNLVIGASNVMRKPRGKVKARMVKAKVTVKKSRLEKATCQLYDLEDCAGPERRLNIELDLYQMEDY